MRKATTFQTKKLELLNKYQERVEKALKTERDAEFRLCLIDQYTTDLQVEMLKLSGYTADEAINEVFSNKGSK